jgi:hypothetical protein
MKCCETYPWRAPLHVGEYSPRARILVSSQYAYAISLHLPTCSRLFICLTCVHIWCLLVYLIRMCIVCVFIRMFSTLTWIRMCLINLSGCTPTWKGGCKKGTHGNWSKRTESIHSSRSHKIAKCGNCCIKIKKKGGTCYDSHWNILVNWICY